MVGGSSVSVGGSVSVGIRMVGLGVSVAVEEGVRVGVSVKVGVAENVGIFVVGNRNKVLVGTGVQVLVLVGEGEGEMAAVFCKSCWRSKYTAANPRP
jgi:hypothetical protein